MTIPKSGRPPHIPKEQFREWHTPGYIDKWLLIDGIMVSSWIARRQRLGDPVPFKTHAGIKKKYRLIDIVAIARGSGATLTVPEWFGVDEEISRVKSRLKELKADLDRLKYERDKLGKNIEKIKLEQPDYFERLSPYIHSEFDIISKSSPVASTTGIYFLIKNDKVVYVGQSVNFMARLASHELSKDFDRVSFLPCPISLLPQMESFYIHMLRPKLNGQHSSGKMVAPVSREAIALVSYFQNTENLACR